MSGLEAGETEHAETVPMPFRIFPSRGMRVAKTAAFILAAGLSVVAFVAAIALRYQGAGSGLVHASLLLGLPLARPVLSPRAPAAALLRPPRPVLAGH